MCGSIMQNTPITGFRTKVFSEMVIALAANTSWYLWNFRRGLIKQLLSQGHEVLLVAPSDDTTALLENMGCRYLSIEIDRKGKNPITELGLIIEYFRILKSQKPKYLFLFTVKPVIYGTVVAGLLGIVGIATITGLGTVFIRRSLLTVVLKNLYQIPFRFCAAVFLQNKEDGKLLLPKKKKPNAKIFYVAGSGVDLEYFRFSAEDVGNHEQETFTFIFIGRILEDKGIREFIEASRVILGSHKGVEFQVVGPVDPGNQTGISLKEIQDWQSEGVIRYLGKVDDVRPFVLSSSCVVLPSYREGLPRSLLEAGAIGRPVIATQVPGCKDVVIEGKTGFLCAPQDSVDLAKKMAMVLALSRQERLDMGVRARVHIEKNFDEKVIIAQYLSVLSASTS